MTIDPTLISGAGLAVMSVIGYFLKRVHNQVDDNAKTLHAFGLEFNAKIDKLESKIEQETKATKSEIVQIFQTICHERQESCGKLRDAKLSAVETAYKAQCNKIHAVIDDRNRRWEKQDTINDQVKSHLAKNHD